MIPVTEGEKIVIEPPSLPEIDKHGRLSKVAEWQVVAKLRVYSPNQNLEPELLNSAYLSAVISHTLAKGQHGILGELLAALPPQCLLKIPGKSWIEIQKHLFLYQNEVYEFLLHLIVEEFEMLGGKETKIVPVDMLLTLRSVGVLRDFKKALILWRESQPQDYSIHAGWLRDVAKASGVQPFKLLWMD